MGVCVKNLFYFLHNAVICLQTTLSHPCSLLRLDVLNWPVTLLHRAVTWKMLSTDSVGALGDYRSRFHLSTCMIREQPISIPTPLLISALCESTASLGMPMVLCESTQSCPVLTSQSLPLCTRRAPRSWPQHISPACISSLICASCRSFLLPWCRLLPGNKARNISVTPTRLFVSPGVSKPVEGEVLLEGKGWGAKCHLSTLQLIKATGALTETKSTFPIHTKKLSEITYISYSALNLFQGT